MSLGNLLRKFVPKSVYARNIITLMTGTTLAQAIPIAISPILTRLYGPEDFGLFALYMAIVSIVAILVTGRYELAILLPKQDRDGAHIVTLSILLSVVLSAFLLILILIVKKPIIALLGVPALENWLYWVPASTLLTGIYQSLYYWSNRKSQYKRIAISRTLQNSSISVTQLASGYLNATTFGLIGGQLTGQLVSTSALSKMIWNEDQETIRKINKRRLLILAKRYINFPKFLIVAHTFNVASWQMPVILLGALFNTAIAGFYTLTQRVLTAPLVVIATALGDVFRQEASHAYAHQGNCKAIYQKTFKLLFLISALPFLIFFFIAPDLFSFVFGDHWRIAGEYAQILTPMFFFQFITSPLSVMFMIAEKQRYDLIWQLSLFVVTGASFVIGYFLNNPTLALKLFSAGYSFMYALSGFMTYSFAKNKH